MNQLDRIAEDDEELWDALTHSRVATNEKEVPPYPVIKIDAPESLGRNYRLGKDALDKLLR